MTRSLKIFVSEFGRRVFVTYMHNLDLSHHFGVGRFLSNRFETNRKTSLFQTEEAGDLREDPA